MFVQQKRRMCYHQEMAPSYHFPMSWQMSPLWTKLRWKRCWSIQPSTIRCLLEGSYSWMYRLSRKLEIQWIWKCMSLRRKIPYRANPKILTFGNKNQNAFLIRQKRKVCSSILTILSLSLYFLILYPLFLWILELFIL